MNELAEIPVFPAARELSLADKTLLDRLFADLQPRVSELTFAGLYLFRQAHAYRLSRFEESALVLGRGFDGSEYVLPPIAPDPLPALEMLFATGNTVYGADAEFARRYLRRCDVHVAADRDNFDYLYLRDELASLPGNRYHKKKNRVSYFTRRHEYLSLPYSLEHQAGCLALLAEWERVIHPETGTAMAQETKACCEALQLVETLGLQGVVILVEGEVVAFTLGEQLNRNTAVCHFEKASPFMEGAAQLVNLEFCRMLFTDSTYVNREQDLGVTGLRAAKLSYHPVELVEKYRIYPTRFL